MSKKEIKDEYGSQPVVTGYWYPSTNLSFPTHTTFDFKNK